MDTLITAIIPVYNREKELDITMHGIINQTYKNIEIILVDDGSTDNSLRICNDYKAQDDRITVIHQDNKGVSSARNTGVKYANGEYISFIDAGDIVETELYETLMPYVKHNIDFIEYSHSVLAKDGNSYKSENKCEKNKIYDKNFIDTEFLPCLLNLKENKNQLNLNFIWKILFKKQLIDSYNIKFNENVRKWEDREFVIEYINCCKNVVFIEKSLYTYICGDSQEHLASKYYKTLLNECIEKLQKREIIFKNKYDFSQKYYLNYTVNVFIGRLLEIINHENKETAKSLINNFIQNEFIILIFCRRESCGRYYNAFKKYIFNKDVDGLYDFVTKSKNKKPNLKQKVKNYLYKIKHLKS